MLRLTRYIFITLFLYTTLSADTIKEYEIEFKGIETSELSELLFANSQLVKLKDKPPGTEAALKRRAENDIPNLIKVLHSQALYNAKVSVNVQENKVLYTIEPGPVYPIADFVIEPEWLNIYPIHLGIQVGQPAYPKDILEAEERIITILAEAGYPLANIKGRNVVADQEEKAIYVTIDVDPGKCVYFGETTIKGNELVCETYIRKKIDWKKGSIYDPEKIDRTISALEATGLFSVITITHEDEPSKDLRLPMLIEVEEGKRRSIGLGVGYATQRGPGFTAEWENRNLWGMGEKLFFEANILTELQEIKVKFLKPDFLARRQDLLWLGELKRDVTEGYTENSFSLAGIIERQVNDYTRVSMGGQYKQLYTTRSDNNGDFNLFKIPMQIRYSNINNALNPTSGINSFFRAIPTSQFTNDSFVYSINQLVSSTYLPLDPDGKYVFATKVNLGSIIGASESTIPAPEKFYAGSEGTLRGYRYYTVSPLDKDDNPIGGRSLFVTNLEARVQLTANWGVVGFFDIGNVYENSFPQFDRKMLRSTGLGVRYFTPVGPLRLDVAIPLDRRKGVDDPYQIYFSVGQSF